jgi:hypothetical protein
VVAAGAPLAAGPPGCLRRARWSQIPGPSTALRVIHPTYYSSLSQNGDRTPRIQESCPRFGSQNGDRTPRIQESCPRFGRGFYTSQYFLWPAAVKIARFTATSMSLTL